MSVRVGLVAANTETQPLLHKKKVLMVSPVPTHPPSSGNRARVLGLAEIVRSLGYELHFLHVEMEPSDDARMNEYWGDNLYGAHVYPHRSRWRWMLRRVCAKLNGECAYRFGLDEWYPRNIDPQLAALQAVHTYHAVIAEYVFMSRALLAFPSATIKILDTHDVFTNRHRHYLENGLRPSWYSTTRHAEARGLNRANAVLAIQEEEAGYFRKICSKEVVTVGHNVAVSEFDNAAMRKDRILFVASGNNINYQALRFLMDEVMDRVRAACPHAELAVAGTICERLDRCDTVTSLGFVEDLSAVYATAQVVVNPVQVGTGLKIKTIEALASARPVITTPVGAQGLQAHLNGALQIASSAKEFADKIVGVLNMDKAERERLVQAESELVARCNRRNTHAISQALRGRTESGS